MDIMTRGQFRDAVFLRDNHKCVLCGAEAQDAHHIIERRLWPDGGYYLDNGASVCGPCHFKCESTEISVEQIRQACGVKKVLPSQFYDDDVIDKWGNYILPNGTRFRGELFYDESVQKIIAPYLPLFSKYVKHPRTYHLPWSEGLQSDDVKMVDVNNFEGKEVVVLEKLDGENTSFYNDYFHARSLDSNNHPSRNRAKAIWASICGELPEGYRFVIENMYAKHSIEYNNLVSYVYGLFVWDDKNVCLSWKNTQEWFALLNIPMPAVLYEGVFNENTIKAIKIDPSAMEGYVVRIKDSFSYSQFKYSVAKYVRANHVQTKHWNSMEIIPNKLGRTK